MNNKRKMKKKKKLVGYNLQHFQQSLIFQFLLPKNVEPETGVCTWKVYFDMQSQGTEVEGRVERMEQAKRQIQSMAWGCTGYSYRRMALSAFGNRLSDFINKNTQYTPLIWISANKYFVLVKVCLMQYLRYCLEVFLLVWVFKFTLAPHIFYMATLAENSKWLWLSIQECESEEYLSLGSFSNWTKFAGMELRSQGNGTQKIISNAAEASCLRRHLTLLVAILTAGTIRWHNLII
jgi:hypothetical protein